MCGEGHWRREIGQKVDGSGRSGVGVEDAREGASTTEVAVGRREGDGGHGGVRHAEDTGIELVDILCRISYWSVGSGRQNHRAKTV